MYIYAFIWNTFKILMYYVKIIKESNNYACLIYSMLIYAVNIFFSKFFHSHQAEVWLYTHRHLEDRMKQFHRACMGVYKEES